MIPVKELRIGNLINHYNWQKLGRMLTPVVGVVTQISQRDFVINHKWNGKKAEGIPLTPEWLQKCEFSWDHGDFELNGVTIGEYEEWEGETVFSFNRSDRPNTKFAEIKYLHQLQNLYFALTGEELKIQHI